MCWLAGWHACLSVCLFVCLFVCMFVCLFVCLFFFLAFFLSSLPTYLLLTYWFIYLLTCLLFYLLIHLFLVCVLTCLFVYWSVPLFRSLFVRLCGCFFGFFFACLFVRLPHLVYLLVCLHARLSDIANRAQPPLKTPTPHGFSVGGESANAHKAASGATRYMHHAYMDHQLWANTDAHHAWMEPCLVTSTSQREKKLNPMPTPNEQEPLLWIGKCSSLAKWCFLLKGALWCLMCLGGSTPYPVKIFR